MMMDRKIRGGAAVAHLTEVSPWEAEFILNLRLFLDGASGRAQLARTYSEVFGSAGAPHFQQFERLVCAVQANMLRPFVHHELTFGSIGSDEAVLTNLVRLASEGELHEAAMIATLMVRPAQAEFVAMLAGDVGTCVKSMIAHPHPHKLGNGPAPVRLH